MEQHREREDTGSLHILFVSFSFLSLARLCSVTSQRSRLGLGIGSLLLDEQTSHRHNRRFG